MTRRLSRIASVVAAGLSIGACDAFLFPPVLEYDSEACAAVDARLSGWGWGFGLALPNPASLYCGELGGASGQDSVCALPDGTEQDEWDLFCTDCPTSGWCE